MFISSGGGSGKGGAHPNQQTASTTTTPTAQQQNANLPQQIFQPNIQQVVMPPAFHPSYMSRPPTSQLYTSTPQIHFSQSQITQGFAGYPYFFPNALISAQHRPNIIQGSIPHNPNALTLSGVSVVPTSITPQPPCQTTAYHQPSLGGNPATIKKRKHAIAIINPVTKKNVLDEYQMSKLRGVTDSKHKTKPIETESFGEQFTQIKTVIPPTQQHQQQSYITSENIEKNISMSENVINKDENSNNISNNKDKKEHISQNSSKTVKILVKDSSTCTTNDYTELVVPSEVISDNVTVSKSRQNNFDNNGINRKNNAKEGSKIEVKSEKETSSTSSKLEQFHEESKSIISEGSQVTTQHRKFYPRTEASLSSQEINSIGPAERAKIHSKIGIENKKINIPKRKKFQPLETAERRVFENNRKKTEIEEDIRRRNEKKKEDADNHSKKKEKRTGEQEETKTLSHTKHVESTCSVTDGIAKVLSSSEKCQSALNISKPDEKILTRKFDNELTRSNETMWQNNDNRVSKENVKTNSETEKLRTKTSPFEINYKEGQWSPSNTQGKKAYDIQQLLLLGHTTQSRVKPKINTRASNIFLQNARSPPALLPFNSGKNYKNNQSSSNNESHNIQNLSCNSKSISKTGIIGKQGSKVNKPGMIHVRLSLRENIKLNETENAWKPMHLKSTEGMNPDNRQKEGLFRRIRGILNKLTPEKFDTLLEEIMNLQIDTPDKINGVMMLVFEKAIDEPNFSASYARLCQRLADKNLQCEVEESKIKAANLVFKTALLDKTEREFHDNVIDLQAKHTKLNPTIEQLKKCNDPRKKQEIQVMLEEQEYLLRRRSCGTVRFIGELFKMSMLTGNIIKACIGKLLDTKSEDKLECLCKLLTTVGKKFESISVGKESKGSNYLDDVIKRMQNIVDKRSDGGRISNRVRFMLQDVIDLRKTKWVASRPEQQLKVLEHNSSEQQSSSIGSYTLGKKCEKQHDLRLSSMKSYDTESSSYHTKSNLQNSDEMWFKQTKSSHIVDTNKLKQIFNVEDPIKLGDSSQFMWRRGNTTNTGSELMSLSSTQRVDSTTKKQSTCSDNKGDKGDNIIRNGSPTHCIPLSKSNSQSNLLSCKSSTLPKKIKSATLVNSATSLQSKDLICTPSDISDNDNKKVYAALNKMIDTAMEQSTDACLDIWIEIPKKLHWVLVYNIFTDYLHLVKTKSLTRKTLSDIVLLLLQKNYLELEDFKKGYAEFCKIVNEIVIDVPEAWKYIFEFIGIFIHKKLFSIKFFLNRCLLDEKLWKQMFKNFILYFTREFGPNYMRNLWHSAHFEWKDFLSENEIRRFINDNKFFFLEDRNVLPPLPNDPDIERIIQHVRKLLKNHSNADDVIDYLGGNIGSISMNFIQNLTLALCECALNYENENYTLNQSFFKKRCVHLLHRYIDSKEERELKCLSTMEEFVSDLGYPSNLLASLFSELYEADIIPEESFIKWWNSRRESTEKTPIILELSGFFSWLSRGENDEN